MKKAIIFGLALVMLLGLAACGSAEENDTSAGDGRETITSEYTEESEKNDDADKETREPDVAQGRSASLNEKTAERFGECGENVRWYYSDGLLVFRGSGKIPFCALSVELGEDVTEIIIEEGINSIGNSALQYFTELEEVVIPNSVTEIGMCAFFGCSSLSEISLPDSVTSIGAGAFNSCSGLKSIVIPEGVPEIGVETFSRCTSLSSVSIPDSVTCIGGSAFSGCESLSSVCIPASVTSIDPIAFYGCDGLTINYEGTLEQWEATGAENAVGSTNDVVIHCN